jgi:hypothetical protein
MDIQNIQHPFIPAGNSRESSNRTITSWQPIEELQKAVSPDKNTNIGRGESRLSQPEEQFFEQLYPNAIPEIRAYNTYKRDGAQIALNTGTLIDRKG